MPKNNIFLFCFVFVFLVCSERDTHNNKMSDFIWFFHFFHLSNLIDVVVIKISSKTKQLFFPCIIWIWKVKSHINREFFIIFCSKWNWIFVVVSPIYDIYVIPIFFWKSTQQYVDMCCVWEYMNDWMNEWVELIFVFFSKKKN